MSASHSAAPDSTPDSVSGADPAPGGDTVAVGAMHPAGGGHLDGTSQADMRFLGAGATAAAAGGSKLRVDFVDLSATGAGPQGAGASDSALIRFADWQAVNADNATVGGGAGGPEFGAALDQAATAMLGDFSTATSAGVGGGAAMMDVPDRPGGAVADSGTVALVRVPLIIHS